MIRSFLLALLLTAPALAQDLPDAYTLTPITVPGFAFGSSANDVSDAGLVIGTFSTEDVPGPVDPALVFQWQDGVVVRTVSVGANAVAESGETVGNVSEPAAPFLGELRGHALPAGGEPVPLPTLPIENARATSYARGLNAQGVRVGNARTNDPAWGSDDYNAYHAVAWPAGGGIVDLGTLGGGYSRATDVNEAGVIAGAATAGGQLRAVRWTPDGAGGYTTENLGTIGGGAFSEGKRVLPDGSIVGEANTAASPFLHAAVWAPDGTGRLLPRLAAEGDCILRDANTLGWALGLCDARVAGVRTRQVVVWVDEQPVAIEPRLDASADGWTLVNASRLNASGWIVGTGTREGFVDSDGEPEFFAFVLRPAEPVSADGAPDVAAFAAVAAPNPVGAGGTVLRVTLPTAAALSAEIYDVRGRRVRALHGGDRPAGLAALAWDGMDANGRAVAPGVYLARVTAGDGVATVRVAVTR